MKWLHCGFCNERGGRQRIRKNEMGLVGGMCELIQVGKKEFRHTYAVVKNRILNKAWSLFLT